MKLAIYNFLKEKEQQGSLTNRKKRVLMNIDRYLKNLKKGFRKNTKLQYYIRLRLFI